MSHQITIKHLDKYEMDLLEPLWLALYTDQTEKGMLLCLPEDAFQKWRDSISGQLGRFACLLAAVKDSKIIGFIAGRIRSMPAYFGGQQVGFISDVFVLESHRRQGVGERLLSEAAAWFTQKEIKRMELQVVAGNHQARQFYRNLGWIEELLQMVAILPNSKMTENEAQKRQVENKSKAENG